MTPVVAPLDDDERAAWLRLSRCGGVGPLTFLALLRRFGSATAALKALPRFERQLGRRIDMADPGVVRREYDAALTSGLRFVALNEPDYPPALRATEGPPPLLCIRGAASGLEKPMVAIVGSRNASANGLLFAERLGDAIGRAGFLIVSGLARGIDARAHRASLATGTVAVLAGGQHRIYPAEHGRLAEEIVDKGGAVLSEMPLEWEPRGRDFPRRNRIVSGLALGTVVVEAARRSGSLITARLANDQGREVFAVPGSPLDPRAEGTNNLLRSGATLCTSPDDVIDALGPASQPIRLEESRPALRFRDGPAVDLATLLDDSVSEEPPVREPEGDDEDRVLALLGGVPATLDDIVRLSNLPPARIRAILVDLELAGTVRRQPDASVVRA